MSFTHLLTKQTRASNTMKRKNHFKSNENSVYSNLQGNEQKTYGNLTAWDFPFYGSNSSLVAKYFSYMWLLQPITTPFIYEYMKKDIAVKRHFIMNETFFPIQMRGITFILL